MSASDRKDRPGLPVSPGDTPPSDEPERLPNEMPPLAPERVPEPYPLHDPHIADPKLPSSHPDLPAGPTEPLPRKA